MAANNTENKLKALDALAATETKAWQAYKKIMNFKKGFKSKADHQERTRRANKAFDDAMASANERRARI